MGNNNNSLLTRLQDTLFNNSWMSELYGDQRKAQQKKIKDLFTVVSDNDVTEKGKTKLEAQAETLADKVERLEAKMAVLAEEMAKNEKEIERHANEITNLVTQAEDQSEEMQEKQKKLVTYAIEDVFYMYEKGQIGHDAIVPEIRTRIKNGSSLKSNQIAIEKILTKLDGKESQVKGLVESATKWIDQKNLLEAQYGATKSSYELLQKSIGQVGATSTSYQNYDLNTTSPVYSPEKVGIVADLMDNIGYNVPATNKDYQENSAPMSKDAFNEKYANLIGATATSGVDSCSIKNEAVVNLGKALDMGLLNDMVSAGMDYGEMKEYLATNFAGASIGLKDDKLSIPYGHGADAQAIFTKLTDGIKEYNTGFLGANNTWDEAGNTISSNNQIAALQNFIQSGKLKELAEGDPAFTFKEAMYALFNPDSGLFKDSGVVYDVSKQDGNASYFIEFAGDEETAQFYKDMSDEIYELWGVKPSRGASFEQYDETGEAADDSSLPTEDETPVRTDPIWFNLGNTNDKFSFVIDRDNDGTFSGKTDFVGGQEGKTWLDDLKSLDTDGDGKITGEELKELKILGTKYTDGAKSGDSNLAFNPEETQSDKKFFRTDDTQVEYSIQSAYSMGITEIDLNGLEEQVNNSTGKTDINNNELFNDSFTFKMNGQDIVVHRQDETNAFMEAIYGDAEGKNFEIGIKGNDADTIINKDYGEFDNFDARFATLFENVGILRNAGDIAKEARALYDETNSNITKYQSAELAKAANKAAAEANVSGWNSVSQKIQSIARNEGITIDMTQAEGIYILDESLDAYGVVEEYKKQQKMLQEAEAFSNYQKEAWSAVIELAKNGISPNTTEIIDLLKEGKAKTAEDVVAILKEAQGDTGASLEIRTKELGFDSEREEEIYTAFNNYYKQHCVENADEKIANNQAIDPQGIVVKALGELCQKQVETGGKYMVDMSAEELAASFLKEYVLDKE